MNDLTRVTALTLSIGAVERDTGLSKDTLRAWERRYGFPSPGRDALGERAYTIDQVEKLRLIKRLMDGGHRPGRIVPLPFGELLPMSALADSAGAEPAGREGAGSAAEPTDLRRCLDLLQAHEVRGLHTELMRALARCGLARFVVEIVGPLSAAIGDAWMRGQLQIFEEHMATERLQVVLRHAMGGLPEPAPDARPRVLLTTLPGEPHGLGLLMAEALFRLEGCPCVSLGTQTPLWDVVLAAAAYRSDIVALGFTGCINPNQVVDSLVELRMKLPQQTQIWAGGSAPVLHRRRVPGVLPLASLEALPQELRGLRATT